MPFAQVRGVNINYEVLGKRGPWMAISPGGRRALGEIRYLAEPLAAAGYRAVREGGMAAVCETEHFRERIEGNPANRDKLMAMDPEQFVAAMTHWREYFLQGADLPVIGATTSDLNSITVPTCIIPGNDKTHGLETGKAAHQLIPNSELHHLFTEQLDVDLGPMEEWHAKAGEHAGILLDFLRRQRMSAAAA